MPRSNTKAKIRVERNAKNIEIKKNLSTIVEQLKFIIRKDYQNIIKIRQYW